MRGDDAIEIRVNLQEVIWTGACRRGGNGFLLLLFTLALRFVWNETFFSHDLSPSLSPPLSTDPQLIDKACLHYISSGC